MNSLYPVKEDNSESSSSISEEVFPIPQPMEGLHEVGPPPFLTKTYEMVDDITTNHIISWSRGGHSFVVWDPRAFASTFLPLHFKHSNFSSFIRQLHTYGFRKIDPDRWEFGNEAFVRGQRQLLKNIKRRKNSSHPHPFAFQQVGVNGGLINRLKLDKQALMMEIVKLRHQQQKSRAYLQAMEQKVQAREIKQKQMMSFLSRALLNPYFLQQLVQQKRRPISQGPLGHLESVGSTKVEPLEFGGPYGYDDHDRKIKVLEEALSKKGKRPIHRGPLGHLESVGSSEVEPLEIGELYGCDQGPMGHLESVGSTKFEPLEFGGPYGYNNHDGKMKELEEALSKKGKRPIHQGPLGHLESIGSSEVEPLEIGELYGCDQGPMGHLESVGSTKIEPLEFGGPYGYGDHDGFAELDQQNEKMKELEEALSKKAGKRPIHQGPLGHLESVGSSKVGPLEFGGPLGYYEDGLSELEKLALEIQSHGRTKREQREEFEGGDQQLDDEFWDNLFKESLIRGSDDCISFSHSNFRCPSMIR